MCTRTSTQAEAYGIHPLKSSLLLSGPRAPPPPWGPPMSREPPPYCTSFRPTQHPPNSCNWQGPSIAEQWLTGPGASSKPPTPPTDFLVLVCRTPAMTPRPAFRILGHPAAVTIMSPPGGGNHLVAPCPRLLSSPGFSQDPSLDPAREVCHPQLSSCV